MPTCPICGESAVARLTHGDAKRLRTPGHYVHVDHGRAYLHRMEWARSAPEDLRV
jgi:hypothetical protein